MGLLTLKSFLLFFEEQIAKFVCENLDSFLKLLALPDIACGSGHDESSVDHGVGVLYHVDIFNCLHF